MIITTVVEMIVQELVVIHALEAHLCVLSHQLAKNQAATDQSLLLTQLLLIQPQPLLIQPQLQKYLLDKTYFYPK
jgi:hypothetical protein